MVAPILPVRRRGGCPHPPDFCLPVTLPVGVDAHIDPFRRCARPSGRQGWRPLRLREYVPVGSILRIDRSENRHTLAAVGAAIGRLFGVSLGISLRFLFHKNHLPIGEALNCTQFAGCAVGTLLFPSPDGQDDLADALAVLQKSMRLLGLYNRENLVNSRLYKSFFNFRKHVFDKLGKNLCLNLRCS